MSLISVTVNGRTYTVDCQNGQEEHARQMAEAVEKRVVMMQKAGFRGENRPVVMASLLLADELSEASRYHHEEIATEEIAQEEREQVAQLSHQLERLAEQAETLADSIENSYNDSSEAS